jgi:hypothetical protein
MRSLNNWPTRQGHYFLRVTPLARNGVSVALAFGLYFFFGVMLPGSAETGVNEVSVADVLGLFDEALCIGISDRFFVSSLI